MADNAYGTLSDGQTITVKVRRTPPAPEVETFSVEVLGGMSVFNVLERIRDNVDPSLAIPISCRIGKCDICFVKVNGKVRWACTEPATDGMLIEPAPRYVILKDLVVDLDKRIKGAADDAETDGEGQ